MFSLIYIYRELRRRIGRTVLTVLGLALGVGLVAAVTAVSNGLDAAQAEVLNPLASVGTDLVVTRPLGTTATASTQTEAPAGPGFGFVGPGGDRPGGGLTPQDQAALAQENQSVITDLSKLGNPGERFVHDYFLPATQLTFPQEQVSTVTAVDGVEEVAPGLTLLAVHQEGTVPQIVAEIQTGGEQFEVNEAIEPPTPEEEAQIRACLQERQRSGQGGGPGECFPERLRNFRRTFTTPQRTITQALNPPQTDIESETYTIAGVDFSRNGLGLLTEEQVTSGSFFTSTSEKEAILAEAYAGRMTLKIGDELNLNGTVFKIVGLAKPPLGGQVADVYLTLPELQTLSGREGRANVLLVRADDADAVDGLEDEIKETFSGAQVTSAKDVADTVSGSLVNAANLVDRLGFVVSGVMLAAAFLIAILLTLSSVAKRVRELGTLKAIGWRQSRVVRQVMGESLAQGLLGGIVGIGLGFAAAFLISAVVPPLEASSSQMSGSGASVFGLGEVAPAAKAVIALRAPVDLSVLLLALGLAVAGGLIAGAAGALRAARLRPADAFREIG